MSSLMAFMDTAWAEALAWAVLHSLWQASLIAIVLRLLLQLLPSRRVRLRYQLAYAALLLQGLAFGLTAWWTYPEEALAMPPAAHSFFLLVEPTSTVSTLTMSERAIMLVEPYLPIILGFWLVGLCFFLVRLGVGLWHSQRLRREGLTVAPVVWTDLLDRLSRHFQLGRPVALKLSDRVSGPMILGQLKPLILLPVGLVNQLSTAEVELILTHELAHLQRYDYVFNFVQSLLEAILYYHPAVWWTGNQIRNLREACCDEWVTTTPGRSLQYARTLLTLAEQAQVAHSNLQLALLGNRRSTLYQRIQHILNQPTKQTDMREKFAVTALLILLAIGVSLHAGTADADLFAEGPPPAWEMAVDTLPDGNIRFSITEDGESFDVELVDRQIKRLEIDGEEIPAERFPEYEQIVEEKMASFPTPPPPPPPPLAPGAPDAPPPPPAPRFERSRIIIDQDEDQVIFLDEADTDVAFMDVSADSIEVINVMEDDGLRHTVIVTKEGEGGERRIQVIAQEIELDEEEEFRGRALRSWRTEKGQHIIIDRNGDGYESREEEGFDHILDEIDPNDIETIDVNKTGDDGVSTVTIRLKNGDVRELLIAQDGSIAQDQVRLEGRPDRRRMNRERAMMQRDRERTELRRQSIGIEREQARALTEQARELARMEQELERQRRGEIELAEEELNRMREEREQLRKEMDEIAREIVEEKEIIVLRSREADAAAREALEEMDFDWDMDVDVDIPFVAAGEDWLKSYLSDKGYLSDPRNYSIKLDTKKLKVNGKRLPNGVHEEVLEIYEELYGKPLSGSISKSESNN